MRNLTTKIQCLFPKRHSCVSILDQKSKMNVITQPVAMKVNFACLRQVGASQVQLQEDEDKSYLLYGAPGVDIWEGSAYLAESLDDVKLSKKIDKRNVDPWDFNQYIGYAVAICRMSGPDNPLDMITG